ARRRRRTQGLARAERHPEHPDGRRHAGVRARAPGGEPLMPRTRAKPRKKIDPARIYDLLAERYPDAHCELDFTNAFELLCATILSAQCTDKRVNMVTPTLLPTYLDARALAGARQEDVEEIVKTTGFFRNKAKSLIAMARALVERHGGEVPRTMEEL